MLLSWPPSPRDALTGIFVSAFVTLMTKDMLVYGRARIKNPLKLLWFGYYVVVFVWECLKANIDVAYRVIHPDLSIRPGTLRVKTGLKSDAGLTFLANSITLTPGTTTVDVDRDRGYIYVHRLYIRKDFDCNCEKMPIVEKFENILKKIFE
jgi:multicomponent Na+:H+ antiporter subunit E